MSGKIWIPEVSRERIVELAKRIKPVVQFPYIGKCYIKPVDLFSVAFTWAPSLLKRARKLKQLCDITTYHTYCYYGFFKPSIAEVLAQIPEEYIDKVVAFEIIKCPNEANDFNDDRDAFYAGYHVATTRLYVKK